AIGSRALIDRAWSCRSRFGRRASFDHHRKLGGPAPLPGPSSTRFAETDRIALIIKRREAGTACSGAGIEFACTQKALWLGTSRTTLSRVISNRLENCD